MKVFLDYFGRFHPVFLHFPIALLLLAAAVETGRVWRDSQWLARCTVWLLGLGALSAIATGASGWLLAAHEHIRSDQHITLEWHRWLGVATVAAAWVAWVAAAAWRETPSVVRIWLRRILVWGAGALVAFAGHFGAMIVWGRDWLS
jgi:uncharacterized membrane protein